MRYELVAPRKAPGQKEIEQSTLLRGEWAERARTLVALESVLVFAHRFMIGIATAFLKRIHAAALIDDQHCRL